MRPDALIFDLDGTLWDTTEACVVAWNRVARELGMAVPVLTVEDIRCVTGLHHTEAVQRVFEAASEAEVEALSKRTQAEDNRVIGEAGGVLYGGVSNCQSGYIEIFLSTSGLSSHFTDYECWGDTGLTKSENLRWIIRRHSLRAPWFVGDTDGDRAAARANHVHFVHAAYGFGQVAECDARIECFSEIVSLLNA